MREKQLHRRATSLTKAWSVAVQAGLVVIMALSGYAEALAQQAPAPPSREPEEGRLLVTRFRVTGSTVFLPGDLQALIADGEGKQLTLREIEALAERITGHYRSKGYILARAYVPAQDIRDGVVEIAVLEGRIGKIEVQGATWYKPGLLSSYIRPAPEAPVFQSDQHERGLLLLNDLPGLEVRSILKPGAEAGTTDVVLNVEKDSPITGSIDANNYGSRFTGRERFGLSLNLNNPLGLGDGLTFRGMTSKRGEDLWLIRAGYSVPLSTWGTKVGGAYTHVESKVGEELRELDIAGAGDVFSLYATHPFVRSRPFSLYGSIGYDHKNFLTTVEGTQVNRDRLRVLSFGGAFDMVDGWRGISNVAITLFQGIPGFLDGLRLDDDRNASRAGASGRFTKLTVDLGRLQQIVGPTSVFLKLGGQSAGTPLTSPEQYAIGGQGTVRGYPIAEEAGDHGWAVSGEFRWNAPGFSNAPAFGGKTWGDVLQLFAFLDEATVVTIDPGVGQARQRELLGTGVGFRFGVPNVFHLKMEYAMPIRKPKPSDNRNDVIYFQFITWF